MRITGGFWRQRQQVNQSVTLPLALAQCEQSGRLENFDRAAEVMRRRRAGEPTLQLEPRTIYPFDDTDAYKVLEGACSLLEQCPDPALAARLDGWIERIAAAQEPDGYLYTFRTMHPDSPSHEWCGHERWASDPVLSHELYNAGHLYEAGVAHFTATGERSLLDVCLRNAELLWREFGDGRHRLAPGHAIVEMALIKLFRATRDDRWLKLARVFLDARGPGGPEYSQQHARVVDQRATVGHAVRANYLYAAMTDVGALTGGRAYLDASAAIWENVVSKKLYLTGGVGALPANESYGAEYELPSAGYNETCATVSLMLWSERLFLQTGHARYMDVFERAAYNGLSSAVSIAGDRFFYTNPLAQDGAQANNHGHAGRAPWFGCACCPPNLLRTLASLSGYFYATSADSLYVNLYAESEGEAHVGETRIALRQNTEYPWRGQIRLRVTPSAPATFAVRLRIPGWARGEPVPSDLYTYERRASSAVDSAPSTNGAPASWSLRVNEEPLTVPLHDGYAVIEREWHPGDVVDLNLRLPVQRVRGHERVEAVRHQVAFERGPIVYAAEQTDPHLPLAELRAPAECDVSPVERPELLSGLTTLRLQPPIGGSFELLPYFSWNNRGLAAMSVWLPE